MKVKEYIRLGKISIKSRKKSTRNTVSGIAFGLILLIPIIFFTFAFYIDLLSTVNETHSVSSYVIPFSANEETKSERYEFLFGQADARALASRTDEEVEQIIRADYYSMGSMYSSVNLTLELGNQKLTSQDMQQGYNYYGGPSDEVHLNTLLKVVKDKSVTDGVISDLQKSGTKLYVAGGDFTGAKGEVIISETLAKKMNYYPAEAVGKQLSANVSGMINSGEIYNPEFYLDNDTNPNNRYTGSANGSEVQGACVLDKFTIVGVVSENYYRINNLTRNDAHIWIDSVSVYDETGVSPYAPILRTTEFEQEMNGETETKNAIVVTYTKSMGELQAAAEEANMFFPALPLLTYATAADVYVSQEILMYQELPLETMTFQCKSYNSATKFGSFINARYGISAGDDSDTDYADRCATDTFSNLTMLNTIGGYLMIVMYTFGGIIFFATLLNLYNSVNYSVQVRKNYMGMMQAIGARKSVIPKLYFVEILLIFARALPWVLVFGGGISFGIKMLIDLIFGGETAAMLGGGISLNFGYFFLALGIVFALVLIIAVLFSLVSCRTITRKGIVEVLSDDK